MKIIAPFRMGEILETDIFLEFHQSMIENSMSPRAGHTMIGFNYTRAEILSVKFYYIFNSERGGYEKCPIPSLDEAYTTLIQHADWPRVNARLSAGSGLTFAIKFDQLLDHAKGFFFRVNRSNDQLINNVSKMHPQFRLDCEDFYGGYGQYAIESRNRVSTSEYIYLKNVNKLWALERKSGIAFSQSGCIEVAAAGCSDRLQQKFIAIGCAGLMKKEFMRAMPNSILDFLGGMQWQFCCPAYYPEKEQFTIYVVGKLTNGEFSCSPIDDLVSGRNSIV